MVQQRTERIVQPTPIRVHGPNLLSSAVVIEETDVHWEQAVVWTPEECGLDGGTVDACFPGTFTYHNVPAPQRFCPVQIYDAKKCSVLGFKGIDVQQRAERALAMQESVLIEKELWTGTEALAASLPNGFLTDANAVEIAGGAAQPPVTALALLEKAIGDAGVINGMIHCLPSTVTFWKSHHLLEKQGDVIYTVNGTVVVPGGGYTGSAPGGGAAPANSAWAFATGQVEIRRGPVQTLYTDTALTDEADNLRKGVAYRSVAVTFSTCLHSGVLVKHTEPT